MHKIAILLLFLSLNVSLLAQNTPKKRAQASAAVNTDCINIHPNPTTGSFSIDRPTQNYSIQVLSIDGTVYLDFSKQSNTQEIDISNLPDGLYYIAVSDNRDSSFLCLKKIVKIT
ncbi:MAG: T9SS type A sorting domain-containing protein [Saprospiraceae bacterium]